LKDLINWDNFWLCCTSHRNTPSSCSEQPELIPGPFNLGLFGSSLLVPKQRAVTSTGAYRMDLGSVRGLYLETGLQSLAGPARGPWQEARVLPRGRKLQATSRKQQATSNKQQAA